MLFFIEAPFSFGRRKGERVLNRCQLSRRIGVRRSSAVAIISRISTPLSHTARMGKHRRIVVAVLAIAVIGVMGWLALTGRHAAREPVYQGKTLSQWLSIWGPAKTNLVAQDSIKCSDAMKHMGTNAIPYLMRMFRTRDSDLMQRLLSAASKQHFVRVHYVSARNLRDRATMGLFMLGADAKDAVPELIQAYDAESDSNLRASVVNIFASIGPGAKAGIPCVLRSVAVTNTNEFERVFATSALGKIHADASNVIPILISNLSDKSKGVQHASATALGQYESNAKAAVPALIKLKEQFPPATYPSYSYGSVYSPDDQIAPLVAPNPGGAAMKALSRIDHETYDAINHKELWEAK
jgi:hypothetical protein